MGGRSGPAPTRTPDPAAITAAFRALAATGADDTSGVVVAAAPGRVNVIGEHTDYAGGLCLPAAIDRHVVCAAVRDTTPVPGRPRFRFASSGHEPGGRWERLAVAVTDELDSLGLAPTRASAGFAATVPEGGGLSSSAAFEVACALALTAVAGHVVEPARIAAACRRAEAAGLGVPCGPMDQVASCLGVAGGAILLDCRSLETRAVALPAGTALIVVDSGIPRTLVGSGYAERVAECAEAAGLLGVASLRDIDIADLGRVDATLPRVLARRVRHVVGENARVVEAVRICDIGGSVADLGRLVDASHESLARDYDVSLPALDAIVAACRTIEGVRGARVVGAGFGGSVLVLVDSRAVDPDAVAAAVPGPACVVHPCAGARVLAPADLPADRPADLPADLRADRPGDP